MTVPSFPVVALAITFPLLSVTLNGVFAKASPVELSVIFIVTLVFPKVVFSVLTLIVTFLLLIVIEFNPVSLILFAYLMVPS